MREGNGYFEKKMEPVAISKIVIKLSEKEQIIGHLAPFDETEEKQTAEIRAEEETLHYREPVAEILCTEADKTDYTGSTSIIIKNNRIKWSE